MHMYQRIIAVSGGVALALSMAAASAQVYLEPAQPYETPPSGAVHTDDGYYVHYYGDQYNRPYYNDYGPPDDSYYGDRDADFSKHNPMGSNPSSEVPNRGLRHRLPSAQGQAQ